MLTRLVSIAALSLAFAMPAFAESAFKPFDKATFEEARDGGGPVLVEIWAEWCSTCARQSPILESLLSDDEFADYTALKLNWDEQEDQAREMGAPRQSTLFVYSGGERQEMSVAETDEDKLRELLRKGL
ncbi:thioredoxin family protein [Methylonatrum kenyense]|uniref:thioredoxin family protein n=1 Tax=Methylonatrum kenyense TaxID=455253 RepID=UPI0020BE9FF9|nr:thioredoxin family protein [Methylonatrum kenyense]MCK8514794.1 thioredoxin family protein [Methylonatrum kenyense]